MILPLVFLLLAGALVAYSFWIYLRAELPVRGGRALAVLRSLALLLLLAIALDVHLPWGGALGTRPRWALLDASLSMSAQGGAAWTRALGRARALEAEGWTVVSFGDGVTGAAASPESPRTALGPAVARAVEAGVSELRVLSDLRFDDPVEAGSALAATPARIDFEAFGDSVLNAGIASFAVSDQLARGDAVDAELEFFAEGVGDSISVEVREEGRLVLARGLPAPAPGLRARVALELPTAQGEGRLRYTAAVTAAGDGFPSDDEAVAYMTAGHEEGGLVVISLRPDWEARALLSVLGEATGLDATGYLRVGPDRFTPMGRAIQRGATVDSARVRAAAEDAALLVVHGLEGRSDAWARGLARRGGRVLLWPLDARAAGELGVTTGPLRQGEWYASPVTTSSPLAADLAGARLRELPPLTSLMPLQRPPTPGAPLLVQLGGTGPGQPALLLERSGSARRGIVLAQGFWRWAARDGDGRDAYRRLWSGVAGWLLAQDAAASVQELRPERWVFARGAPVRWRIPGEPEDSVRLRVEGPSGMVVDTVLQAGSSPSTGPLAPGLYTYAATTAMGEVEGRFDVEARTTEMLPRPREPESLTAARGASILGRDGRSPLRTWPWPYLLVLLLLCAEWIGRRRAGLR